LSRASLTQRVRKICLGLPEAMEKPFGGHTAPAFRVREKIFVFVTQEGPLAIHLKGAPGAQDALVHADPETFYSPPYSGHNGWIGVNLDGRTDWGIVEELIRDSYRLVAPKRLAAQVQ
jgi:predicted DNA-binding protein (MmcQ/YjbR family)